MGSERLKVKTGLGLHLQLFIDATVDKLKRGEHLADLHEQYVSNITQIQALSEQCLSCLRSDDPWRFVFKTIKQEADCAHNTMFQVPVLEHIHALESLATTYDRCTGVKYWYDFLLGNGTEKRIIRTVRSEPFRDETVERKFADILEAIKRQVEYANNVRASLKRE